MGDYESLSRRIKKLETYTRLEHKHGGVGNMPMRAKQAGIEGHLHDLSRHLNYPVGSGGSIAVYEDGLLEHATATSLDFIESAGDVVGMVGAQANINMELYAFLNGRSGGQTLIGGTSAGNDLTLRGDSVGTTGLVIISNSNLQFPSTSFGLVAASGTNLRLTVSDVAGAHVAILDDLGVNGVIHTIKYERWSSQLSPAAWAAQQDDFALTEVGMLRVSLTGNQNLSGMSGGTDGRLVIIHNIDTTDTLTILDESASSVTAANRFALNGNMTLGPEHGALFWYDAASNRWRCAGSSAGGGGVSAHAMLDGGTVHSDTATDTVSRGSIIIGNSTPAWDELTIGTVNTVLKSDGTDISWGVAPSVKWIELPHNAQGSDVVFFPTFLTETYSKLGIFMPVKPSATHTYAFFKTGSGTETGHVTITSSDNYATSTVTYTMTATIDWMAVRHNSAGVDSETSTSPHPDEGLKVYAALIP